MLLASGEGSDVKFVVGDTSFRVHRLILSARSPVFRGMLQGPGKGTVAVEEVEPVVFQAVMRYLYTEGALCPECCAVMCCVVLVVGVSVLSCDALRAESIRTWQTAVHALSHSYRSMRFTMPDRACVAVCRARG